jgi:tRNA modification GTPase
MIAMSATTQAGFDALRAHLKNAIGYAADGGGFSARRRHLDALERSALALHLGNECLEHTAAGELLAEHLRDAQHALGEITGEFTTEELLGEIFHRFCIGK